MSNLKYRPMAVIGITALILIFAAVIAGFIFSCGLIFLAVGAVLTVILLITGDFGKFTVLVYICAAMIFSGTLLMCTSFFDSDVSLKYAGEQCDITAVVTDNKTVSSNSETVALKTETINGRKIETKILACTKTSFSFEPGDVVGFNSKLTDNIASKSLTERLYAISDGEYLYTFLSDASAVKLVKSGDKTIQRFLYLIRKEIKDRIYSFLPGEEGAVTVAMLIGDKSGIDKNIKNNFSNSGISHLFAVSGLHLSVWVMTLYLVLRKLIHKRRLPELFSVFFTLFFMALTGFTASVCRAGLMLIVVLAARLFDEESDSLNSLGLSLFIILMINPMSAVSVSLLLSFCATLGIITLYPLVERKTAERLFLIENKKIRKIFRYILSLAEISICASLFTLPVTAFYIGCVSVFAPVTNVLVSLAATAQMIFGGLSALFYPLLFISRPLVLVCGLLSKYVIFVSDFIADIPFCSVSTDSDYFRYAILIIVSGVICVFLLTENIKKRLISATAVILSVSIFFAGAYIFTDYSKTRINVFNTGGVSVQIKYRGHSVVLGCGGKDNYPEEYVSSKLCDNADFLLVPDRSRHLSSMLLYYTDSCQPKKIVCGENNQSLELLRPDYIVSDGFSYSPWENAGLNFIKDEDNSFALFKIGECSLLIVFKCINSDMIPEELYNSDYLIVSENMPDDFDYSSFGSVIISDESKNTNEIIEDINNENIYTVCSVDDIELEINGNGKTEIKYSKG